MKYVILKKSEVQPFGRIRLGKFERVKGWLLPEKYKVTGYSTDTRGIMNFVQDHMSIEEYGKIITRCAKESKYIMEGVNSAFLDVSNKGRGTLEKMAKTNPVGLKQFLGALFDHVSEDVISLRKDLRKSLEMEVEKSLEKIGKKYGIDMDSFERPPGREAKCIGWSKKRKKWAGFSHRAIGFFNTKEEAIKFANSVR